MTNEEFTAELFPAFVIVFFFLIFFIQLIMTKVKTKYLRIKLISIFTLYLVKIPLSKKMTITMSFESTKQNSPFNFNAFRNSWYLEFLPMSNKFPGPLSRFLSLSQIFPKICKPFCNFSSQSLFPTPTGTTL